MAELELPPVPRRRWRIAALLGIGVLINYFDRVNLSVSHAALITAFGVSNITFGYLSGAYNWTYAMCQLPIGVLLDKFGVKRVGRVGIFLWSVASFAAAGTPNLGGLFLLGVGEAPTFPANAKAVGLWFPPQERSLATSLFDAGAKFGSAIGVPIIGVALLVAGWRWSFALTGVLSLAYILYFWRVYKDPQDDPELSATELAFIHRAPLSSVSAAPPAAPSTLGQLLLRRKVLGLAIGMGAYNYVFYLLLTWLPSYLSFALHIDLLHSFLYTSVPWLFATITAVGIGGWLVDFLVKRGFSATRVRKVVLVGGTAFGLGILGAVPALIAGRNDVDKVGGIMNFSNQISGVAAPIVTGYLVTAFHSYAWAFGVAAVYLVVGIAAYIVLLGKIEMEGSRQAPLAP